MQLQINGVLEPRLYMVRDTHTHTQGTVAAAEPSLHTSTLRTNTQTHTHCTVSSTSTQCLDCAALLLHGCTHYPNLLVCVG